LFNKLEINMESFTTPFTVKDNVINFGKAYAFWEARSEVGTMQSLYLLWVATNMIKHDSKAQGEHADDRYNRLNWM